MKFLIISLLLALSPVLDRSASHFGQEAPQPSQPSQISQPSQPSQSLRTTPESAASTLRPLRESVLLDEGWQFAFGDASSPEKDFGCGTEYFNYLTKAASIHNAGPYSPGFDASDWQIVDLPHDWVTLLPYSPDASHSHGYKQIGYAYPQNSVGWYRKTFTLPQDGSDRIYWLQFDGIFRNCSVFLNGFYLGGEASGYATQIYDITQYLRFGEDNLLCVRVDASLEEGWFYEGAGIYRHVRLHSASPVSIAPFGQFVYALWPREDCSEAVLHVETQLRNRSLSAAEVSVRHTLYDPAGEAVLSFGQNCSGRLNSFRELTLECSVPVESPQLWSPESPRLYSLKTEVIAGGRTIDSLRTSLGLRRVEWDPDRGLVLNTSPYKIKGVNMHQDHAGVGTAIPDGLQEWRLMQLKEFGCNAYRASHNPMTPEMLDACDRLGMLVIEENRLMGVNREHIDLLERMIRRDRNHPSVILWSVGNEEWGIEWNDAGTRIASAMCSYCHRFDPTRKVTVATSGGPAPLLGVDVAGYNYILQNPVDRYREQMPSRIALGSEETSGCGTRGVYFDVPESGRMASLNRSPQGPDSTLNCIGRGWKFYDSRPWLAGLFYWTGFDYRGEPNPLKYPATGSQFGILDHCGFPKDEAWYLKSWWTDEDVIHILPHWNLAGHEGERVSVWVYSNCDEVQLTVNGKRLERKKMERGGYLSWDVTYRPGTVVAQGYRNGRKSVREVISTKGPAVSVRADCERVGDVIVASFSLVDAQGRVVPDACEPVRVSFGKGVELLGAGNGDSAYRDPDRPACDGGSFVLNSFNGLAQAIFRVRGDDTAISASLL